MPRRLQATQEMLDQIKLSTGNAVDPSKIAIFEARGVTTKPIKKAYSIYDKSVISPVALQKLSDQVNSGTFVPIHVLHNQGGWDAGLPTGRIFKAGVAPIPNTSDSALHTLFYLDYTDPASIAIADKLDNGSIQEVSVGVTWNTLPCSGCGFDFLSDQAALWDRTCPNGHALVGGNYHLALDNPKDFNEMSVVSKGASDGARVLDNNQRVLAQEPYTMDNGHRIPNHALLQATFTVVDEGNLTMSAEQLAELEALRASTQTLSAAKTAAEAQVATLTSQVAELTSAKTTAEEQVAILTAAKTTAEEQVSTLTAELDQAKVKLAALEDNNGRLTAQGFKINLSHVVTQPAMQATKPVAKDSVQAKASAFKTV